MHHSQNGGRNGTVQVRRHVSGDSRIALNFSDYEAATILPRVVLKQEQAKAAEINTKCAFVVNTHVIHSRLCTNALAGRSPGQ